MISRFIAPPYALEYQKNHCSPFSLKPGELSLHDTNSHLGNCPRPSPHKSVWVQVANIIAWMAARNLPPERHAVGIMGILVHWYIGTLPHPCRLSPSQYERFVWQSIELSWVSTSMALSAISSLPFEMALMMPLWAAFCPGW